MGVVPSVRLPDELEEYLIGYSAKRHPYDESKAEIYVLTKPNEPTLYLKIRYEGFSRLETECRILKWIKQRVPTPEPIYYSREESTAYLLTSEIEGTPSYQVPKPDRETTVKILAETLKRIHGLDQAGCPFDNRLEHRVSRLVEAGVDVSVLPELRPVENLVFTHGDYCLPNIIINQGKLSGVIDWDYAGLSDPYADFASCIWSLGYNYGIEATRTKWAPLFYETYELGSLDHKKLDFYRKLSDLP